MGAEPTHHHMPDMPGLHTAGPEAQEEAPGDITAAEARAIREGAAQSLAAMGPEACLFFLSKGI